MKVSVVIPAYNEERYIGRCLKSLKNLTVPADEIIVVDNNSTDKTSEIAQSFGTKVVLEKKQGITPARNKGFESTKYEIIARCDADSIIQNDWIKIIKNNFEKLEIDALSGPVFFYDSKFLKLFKTYPSKIALESLKLISKGNRHLVGSNMVITKEIWNKVKNKVTLDDSKVHEDSDLAINIAAVGGSIGYDPNLVVGISARRLKKHPESYLLEYPVRLAKTFWFNRKKLGD